MSRDELLQEIERLRSKLYYLAQSGAGHEEVVNTSKELDMLIVMYHRVALRSRTPT